MQLPRMTWGAGQDRLVEKAFQGQVTDLAAALGWIRKYHNLYAIGSDPGYPDLTLFHPVHGVLWIEVKGVNGKPSAAQVAWVRDIRACGHHAYVAFPRDIGIVEALLRGEIAPPAEGRDGPALDRAVLPLLANEERTR